MSPPSTPMRRFQPEPIETSTTKKVRRFAVEPVETTVKTSRKPTEEPSETTQKAPRRFAPQPVETITRHSREKVIPTETTSKTTRKFAPQPVETSTRHSGESMQKRSEGSSLVSSDTSSTETSVGRRRKFAPEPTEISSRSRHSQDEEEHDDDNDDDEVPLLPHEMSLGPPEDSPPEDTPKKPARRKFAPQLIETAKRSRKVGDTDPAVLPSDKTNISPDDAPDERRPERDFAYMSTNSPLRPTDFLRPTPRKGGTMQPHYNSRSSTRQHSYQIPSLPCIDSSESEESARPSPSLSVNDDSDTSDEAYKDATRRRESMDDRFSGYLLALAARAAEKQLREQAAAAFPNSDYHEPVAHYVNRSGSEDDISEPTIGPNGKPDPTRRDSGDEKWALQEMRRHGERLQKQSMRGKSVAFNVEFDSHAAKQDVWASNTKGGPFASAHQNPKNMIGGHQRDPDLRQMRKAASPPMLGGDISFPRCASPDHARFDVTQGADFLRKQMCYLTGQTTNDKTGLWAVKKSRQDGPLHNGIGASGTWGKNSPSVQSPASPRPTGGLWGGFCTGSDARMPEMPPGIATPARTPAATPTREKEDPFAKFSVTGIDSSAPALASGRSMAIPSAGQRTSRAPPSPPGSHDGTSPKGFAAALDARFEMEVKIEAEYDDGFVTQVYNYLSLGYPSLARKFDDELSRISRVPIEELRADDKMGEVRGHVGLGEDGVDVEDRGVDQTTCRRWRALKRYVREWGRQMMNKEKEQGESGMMMLVDPHRAWGLPDRRGSWGN